MPVPVSQTGTPASTLITSAPRSARIRPQNGPARAWVQSRTTIPSSGPGNALPPSWWVQYIRAVKLSCLPVSFFQSIVDGQMPLEEWLAFAREIGLDGTECSLGFVEPIGRLTGPEVRRLCDRAGVEVSMVTCHSDYTNPDPAERARQIEDMARNLRLAVELGAPLARVLSGQRHPGVSEDDGVAWAVEGL